MRLSEETLGQIREAYAAGAGFRELSERFGASVSALRARAKRENWPAEAREKPPPDAPAAEKTGETGTVENASSLLLGVICRGLREGALADSAHSIRELSAAIKDLSAAEEKSAKPETDNTLRVEFAPNTKEYTE